MSTAVLMLNLFSTIIMDKLLTVYLCWVVDAGFYLIRFQIDKRTGLFQNISCSSLMQVHSTSNVV